MSPALEYELLFIKKFGSNQIIIWNGHGGYSPTLHSFIVLGETIKNTAVASDDDYIKKVCSLFLEFINTTNIFGKIFVEPEDLLPPNAGYIGDIDYNSLPATVSIICKGNDTYKNILRILLVTFNRSVFENKFKNFSYETREKMTNILVRINSKN